jgi:hypothetical protein
MCVVGGLSTVSSAQRRGALVTGTSHRSILDRFALVPYVAVNMRPVVQADSPES